MIQINSKKINFENLEKKIAYKMKNAKKRHRQKPLQPLHTHKHQTTPQESFLIKELYEINDFLKYNNEAFIHNIYKAVLQRECDATGLTHYLNLLYSGERTKLDILLSIRYSPEGKSKNINILGTKKRYYKAQLFKIPVLGHILKTAETLLRLPRLLQKINSIEAILSTKVAPENLENSLQHLQNNLIQEIEKKVNLDDFHKDMKEKADKELLYQEIEKKVNLNDFHKDLNTKVTTENFYKEIEKKVNLSDFHKDLHEYKYNTDETLKQQTEKLELFANDISSAKNHLKYVELNLQKLVQKAEESMLSSGSTDNTMLNALIEEKEHILDALYLSFEDKFRGSRSDIKKRQEYYLPMVQEVAKNENSLVLDIGCGRGEWLELLKENNIQAKGLDLNRLMVETAQEHGLDVTNGDAIAYLKSLEEESLDVISAFHIVEHLPFEVLISLFDESFRVLKKGGIIIFETPNPENLFVGSCSFYTDPTHINPIPPVTLEFLAQERGFKEVTVHKLHPLQETIHNPNNDAQMNRLIEASSTAQDYSIIGTK